MSSAVRFLSSIHSRPPSNRSPAHSTSFITTEGLSKFTTDVSFTTGTGSVVASTVSEEVAAVLMTTGAVSAESASTGKEGPPAPPPDTGPLELLGKILLLGGAFGAFVADAVDVPSTTPT